METQKVLLTNGDSWTFGSEIMAPEFMVDPGKKGHGMAGLYKKGHNDFDEANDYYRIPRIWPTMLANHLGYQCVNLSWPARSNDSIYDTTIGYLLKHYVIPRRSTDDLVVIVGWSSPERKNVVIDEGRTCYMHTIWPAMDDSSFYLSETARRYFRFHVANLWSEHEYISRFIEQNYNLYCFCELHGIRYFCFNSFYQVPGQNPKHWVDIDVAKIVSSWNTEKLGGWIDQVHNWKFRIERLLNQWESIPRSRFILKDQGSFKSHIDATVPQAARMNNWHPSPESHKAWAEYLKNKVGSPPGPSRFSQMIKQGANT